MAITFKDFVELAEGKKKKQKPDKNIPPNAVPGTFKVHPDGSKEYTLKPTEPLNQPLSKKQILKLLAKQGGIGGKAVRKAHGITEVTLGAGETYGSKNYQRRLEQERTQQAQKKQTQRQRNTDSARRAFRTIGIPFSDSRGRGHIVNGVKQYDT